MAHGSSRRLCLRSAALAVVLLQLAGASSVAEQHLSSSSRDGQDSELAQRADRGRRALSSEGEGKPQLPQCRTAPALAARRSMQQEQTHYNTSTPFLLTTQEPVACISCQNPIVDWWQSLCRGDLQAPWGEITKTLCTPEQQAALRHHFSSRGHLYEELLLWQPCDLWPLVRGRTVWVGGDSQSQDFYRALRCALHAFHDYDWVGPYQDLLDHPVHWREPRSPALELGPDDKPSPATCEPLVEGTRICQFRANWGQTMVDHAVPWLAKLAKPGDIFVANFGAWHGHQSGAPDGYWQLVRRLGEEAKAQLPSVRLVWKDTSPTHFDTHLGGFDTSLHSPFTCAPLKVSVQHDGSLKAYSEEGAVLEHGGALNQVAAEALEGLGVPMMHTFNATAELWEAHRGVPGATLECNHYCLPGVPAVWVFFLYKALEPFGPGAAAQ